jgi:hypothetical protein
LTQLSDLVIKLFSDEVAYNLVDSELGKLCCEISVYFLTDFANVRSLSIGFLLNLLSVALSRSYYEDAEDVPVGCFGINEGLYKSLPLSNKLEKLIACHIHAIERRLSCVPIDFIGYEAYLAPLCALCLIIELSQRLLNNSPLDKISGQSCS